MDESDCSFVEFFLVVILVFDHVEVDKIAQIGAGVPANVVGVHIDLPEFLDHLDLVCGVCLRARGCSGQVGCRVMVMVAVCGGKVDGWEGERVGHLEG